MSDSPADHGGPVMDGATEDMSEGGSSKLEAADLLEAGRSVEITPPDSLATGGLGDNPLGQSTPEPSNDDSDEV